MDLPGYKWGSFGVDDHHDNPIETVEKGQLSASKAEVAICPLDTIERSC